MACQSAASTATRYGHGRHYTCDQIATEIAADLDFLAVRGRDAPERHRSMRAALDYSWSMLREGEQQAPSASAPWSPPAQPRMAGILLLRGLLFTQSVL